MSTKGTCRFAGCSRDAVGKGYCKRHYHEWKRGKLPRARYKTCHHPGCRSPQEQGGRCGQHLKRKQAPGAEKEAKGG